MKRKKIIIGALVLILLLCAIAFSLYQKKDYVYLSSRRVEKNSTSLSFTIQNEMDIQQLSQLVGLEKLDLQYSQLTIEEFDALQATLPECHITWYVPFQESLIKNDATSLTISKLSEEDISKLVYFPSLTNIKAEACEDLDVLRLLGTLRPDLTVSYVVPINDQLYPNDTNSLTLENIDVDELDHVLGYLPNVTTIVLEGISDLEMVEKLHSLHPEITVFATFDIYGISVDSTTTELDLSGIQIEQTDMLERMLPFLYQLEKVYMCDCGISSEEMDALWKRNPEVRFVWSVDVGVAHLRTDITSFMPYKYGYDGYSKLKDSQTDEMKYLVDLECMDLGHMAISDYSFLRYMPKMKYLILGDTKGTDFSPLAELKELVFLELFMTRFDQAEVLTELTKLEDLNLGTTSIENVEPLKKMTWLKHLWMPATTKVSYQDKMDLVSALPNTVINYKGASSTGNGWRQLDNYYAMRDMLGMPYLNG